MKRLTVLLALTGALFFPGAAVATHVCSCVWHWGFNHITPGANYVVYSGYNYFSDQYTDKWNGGTIWHGWIEIDSQTCYDDMSGVTTHFHYLSNTPCDAYNRNFLHYISGNSSYTYADSWVYYRG